MTQLEICTRKRSEFVDVTDLVRRAIRDSGLKASAVLVSSPHTTAGITIQENADPDVVHDMVLWLDSRSISSQFQRAVCQVEKKEYERAIQDFEAVLKFDPQYLFGLNSYALLLASCPEEKGRDGKKALEMSQKAVELAKSKVVPIYGLNYKDQRDDALAWLRRFGDPYALSIVDADGRVGIDYGVYGVPETFVIDKAGVIRYKQIGPVTPQALKDRILPLVRQLQQS